MTTVQYILIILLAAELLVIAACVAFISYYLIRILKSVSKFTNSLAQLKNFAAIPALLVALVRKLRRR